MSNYIEPCPKCKATKGTIATCDIFPDDSFNDIISQMPESELSKLTGECARITTPALCRAKELVKQNGMVCSTPKLPDLNNDSSFEIQMSQMNDSQFSRFMDDE